MKIKKILSIILDLLFALLVFTMISYVIAASLERNVNPADWSNLTKCIFGAADIAFTITAVVQAYKDGGDPHDRLNF